MNETALLLGLWIGWLLCGSITMRIASSKRLNNKFWFFIAFSAGPVGIALILIPISRKTGPWNRAGLMGKNGDVNELRKMKKMRDDGQIGHVEYDEARGRLIIKHRS